MSDGSLADGNLRGKNNNIHMLFELVLKSRLMYFLHACLIS